MTFPVETSENRKQFETAVLADLIRKCREAHVPVVKTMRADTALRQVGIIMQQFGEEAGGLMVQAACLEAAGDVIA